MMNSVSSNIMVKPFGVKHQAIISLGDTHFVIGSSVVRDTKTLPSQPMDILLASLAAECTFSCQEAFKQLNIPLSSITTSAVWLESGAAEIRFAICDLEDQQSTAILSWLKSNCKMYNLLAPVLKISLKIMA